MYQKILNSIIFTAILSTSGLFAKDSADSDTPDSTRVYRTPSVTVTGTRINETEAALPHSDFDKEAIDRSYITSDVPKLLSTMTSVMYTSQNGNGVGYSDIKLRGFDQRRIAVMINGIPQNDPEDHEVYWVDLPDLPSAVESIQVQRGAGMGNYGSPSIGGSINMNTNNFANRKGIKYSAGIGFQEYGGENSSFRDNIYKNLFEYSSGLVDNWAVYVKGSKISSDGYRDRSWTTLQSYFVSVAHFSENLSTQVNVFGGPARDALAYNGIPKAYVKDKSLRKKNYAWGGWAYKADGKTVDYAVERSKYETEGYSQPHFELLNDWQITPQWKLQSALFYYQGDGYYDGGTGWADEIFDGIVGNDFTINDASRFKNSYTRAWVKNKQGGWIPKLIFTTDRNELTFGGEIRIHRSNHYLTAIHGDILPENFDMDYKLYSYHGKRNIFSAFIKDNFRIDETFSTFADLQLTHHVFAINNEMLGSTYTTYLDQDGNRVDSKDKDLFNIGYTFLNPRFGVNAKINDQASAYAFIAHTSREPRMKNLYNASDAYSGETPNFAYTLNSNGEFMYNFNLPNAKPEKMLDIEVGAKYTNRNYEVALNLYYMDYRDEFVKTGKIDFSGTSMDENAARSRHIGAELSGAVMLLNSDLQQLKFWGNATYSHNYFVDYDVFFGDDAAGQTKFSLKDNAIAGFPDIMANFGLSYTINDLYVGLTGKYVGEFFTDNYDKMLQDNAELIRILTEEGEYYADNKVDAYLVFDFDASYTFRNLGIIKSLKLQTQICNLTNKLYAYSGEGMEFFPAQERSIFFGFELGL